MKRKVLALVVAGLLVLVPSAWAYVDSTATQNSVSGNGTFGSPTNTFRMSFRASRTDKNAVGNAQIYGSDAQHHLHSFTGFVSCMAVDSTGTNATVLIKISDTINEPSNLYGVLIHATDGASSGADENGSGDALGLVNLNQSQYNAALTAGCSPAAGVSPLSSGNITIIKAG
ncbi:MAG TPA: hypothetical protein VKJ07_20740 [Mycobacteriales bacterium]|nr:hypothetical protein [Mycobacteriales bacterium]